MSSKSLVVVSLVITALLRQTTDGFLMIHAPRNGMLFWNSRLSDTHSVQRAKMLLSLESSPKRSKKQPLGASPNFTLENDERPYRAPNKRASLRWVVQSMERLQEDQTRDAPPPSQTLLDALHALQQARTQREVANIGRTLESLDIHMEARDVQERVIKATAISGLLSLSLKLLQGLLSDGVLPSSMAYIAVCSSLRQAGRVKKVEQLMYRLGQVAKKDPSSRGGGGVDVIAFNTYLAALCDEITTKSTSSSSSGRRRIHRGTFPSLQAAREWLKPGRSYDMCLTEPDTTSYATVLHAAACTGNRDMVEDLWNEMTKTRLLRPSVYCYNSRLRAIRNGGPANDEEALALLEEIKQQPHLQPDQYTIDLVMAPLVRANRIGELEALLGLFVEGGAAQPRKLTRAFEAFLDTLIKDGELSTARAIFDTYLLPSLTNPDTAFSRVEPSVRHFNRLIEGYRQLANDDRFKTNREEELFLANMESGAASFLSEDAVNQYTGEMARESATELYQLLLDSELTPDGFTLTSMMGIAGSSEELTTILSEAIVEEGIEVTPAIVRAAMTFYGQLGHPSSACWMFDNFAGHTMSVRTWNALLGAFADSAMLNRTATLEPASSEIARAFMKVGCVTDTSICVGKLVESMTCAEASKTVLQLMDSRGLRNKLICPAPNAQTYCIAASALQYGNSDSHLAMELFRNATDSNIPADGRFVNAIFRCFGDDIDGALSAWKKEIRQECLNHEYRTRSAPASIYRTRGKNLIAAYNGLLYVCGRAVRSDIALRLIYAMNREGIEPNEVSLNCYRSGKRTAQRLTEDAPGTKERRGLGAAMVKQYESLLTVECTKYDLNDKRRAGEKRVRIIL